MVPISLVTNLMFRSDLESMCVPSVSEVFLVNDQSQCRFSVTQIWTGSVSPLTLWDRNQPGPVDRRTEVQNSDL